MSTLQHERLLRGGFFLPWTESPDEVQLEIGPGEACYVPCRWPHWLSHPGDEPVLSFELGVWTTEALRLRKVNDINWLLRRFHARPAPPGGRLDGAKSRGSSTRSRRSGAAGSTTAAARRFAQLAGASPPPRDAATRARSRA